MQNKHIVQLQTNLQNGLRAVIIFSLRPRVVFISRFIYFTFFFILFMAVAFVQFYPFTYDFEQFPRTTYTKSGEEYDPVNIMFIGSQKQIVQAFTLIGWLIPDPITFQTSQRIILDGILHRSYPTGPISHEYEFNRVEDLAFEKPTNDVGYRDHIRLWRTGEMMQGGQVWIGTASYDHGNELSKSDYLPTHHISMAIDLERNNIVQELKNINKTPTVYYTQYMHPTFVGTNASGDRYMTDGNIAIIPLVKMQPITVPAYKPILGHVKDFIFITGSKTISLLGF